MLKVNIHGDDLLKIIFIGWIALIAAGCSQLLTPLRLSETAPTLTETLAVSIVPTEGDAQMTPALPTPSDAGSQGLIEKAKEDLAQRLSISRIQINLVEMTEVEWSDSSLGCPQPGMDYLQVITPGYLILLGVDAQRYEYHSNRDTYFVLCENSGPPSLPKP